MVKADIKDVPKTAQVKPVEQIKSDIDVKEIKHGEYTAQITRDFYGVADPFYLSEKDPEYAYRFLREEKKNLSTKTGNLLFQKGGWQICPKEHLLRIGMKEGELHADGLLRRGDTILAFMPKQLFLEKEQYRRERAQSPMKAIKRLLKKGDASVGGKAMHETMKGIQTQEALKI